MTGVIESFNAGGGNASQQGLPLAGMNDVIFFTVHSHHGNMDTGKVGAQVCAPEGSDAD